MMPATAAAAAGTDTDTVLLLSYLVTCSIHALAVAVHALIAPAPNLCLLLTPSGYVQYMHTPQNTVACIHSIDSFDVEKAREYKKRNINCKGSILPSKRFSDHFPPLCSFLLKHVNTCMAEIRTHDLGKMLQSTA